MLQDPDKLLLLRLQACKRRGDADLEQGNLRDAINAYTEAIDLLAPPASAIAGNGTAAAATPPLSRAGGGPSASSRQIQCEVLPALLSNRSRACCEAGRYEEALSDALRLLQGAPSVTTSASSRAHYRAGRALDGLKQ